MYKRQIVYIFGEETVTLEGDEIRNWLIFDERGRLQKNEDELRQCVAEYVAQLAATHDTVNTEREFCTTSGRTVQVYSSCLLYTSLLTSLIVLLQPLNHYVP